MNINLSFFDETISVVFYPYRSAQILNPVMKIRFTESDEEKQYEALKKRLCKMAILRYDKTRQCLVPCDGADLDNHICFRVGNVALKFSDSTLTVGNEIKVENW